MKIDVASRQKPYGNSITVTANFQTKLWNRSQPAKERVDNNFKSSSNVQLNFKLLDDN